MQDRPRGAGSRRRASGSIETQCQREVRRGAEILKKDSWSRTRTGTILDAIVATKRREVAEARERVPLGDLVRRAEARDAPLDFRGALTRPGPIALIAEIKKASPSAGVIRPDFDPVAIARSYRRHGASCLSVLTDRDYFQGSLDDLERVREQVAIPILRKDFTIDEYQVVEARASGADAILLIAEVLDDHDLAFLLQAGRRWGMAVLVEFHDPTHLDRVVQAGADLVGINNRDLKRFVTDLETTFRLRDRIPPGVVVVSESGITRRDQVERLERVGVSAILVGESLMREQDPGRAIDRLLGRDSQSSE